MSEYKYKVELHAHTSPVSQCAEISPQGVIQRYADIGVHGICITNHFVPELFKRNSDIVEFFLADFYAAQKEGERLGIKVYLGAELRFSESWNDYLVFGIDRDWLNRAKDYLFLGIDRYLKDFAADKSIIVQAHPFRGGMKPIPQTDGSEVFNMHPSHNSSNHLALLHAQKYNHIQTCGTDFHHDTHQGLGLTLFKALPKDSFELANLLLSKDYMFCIKGEIVKPNYAN